jgi:2-dehydro-3-deoxyphosphogluconate aldolase/(4S)-4-hydroxy-2-oxoglutarate aldolase
VNEAIQMALTIEFLPDKIESVISRTTQEEVRYRISQIGIVPAVRVSSDDDALFVAEALATAGVPILEISMTFPGAIHALTRVAKSFPTITVGAGGVFDAETAWRCADEGAQFLTSDGLIPEVVECAGREEILVLPGVLTPTELIAAWKGGSDFVKVVPCDAVGGPSYIRSIKIAIPQVRLMAVGGVTERTATEYIAAGASMVGVGKELIPAEAIRLRQGQRIQELARRFMNAVASGRP